MKMSVRRCAHHPLNFVLAGTLALVAVSTGMWLANRRTADAADAALTLAIAQTPITYAEDKAAVPLPPATGALKGTILLQGPAPKLAPIGAIAVCGAAVIPNETLMVDPGTGGIANVFVYLDKAPAGFKAVPPAAPVIFDQGGCQFKPHVLFIQVGQPLLILNADLFAHNTHATPIRSDEFNVAIGANERKGIKKDYNKSERNPVPVKCDLHNWMTAHHLVKDHPFGAATNEKGEFEIRNLPAGKHEFIVWQERVGYLDKKYAVTIEAGKVAQGELKFDAKAFGL